MQQRIKVVAAKCAVQLRRLWTVVNGWLQRGFLREYCDLLIGCVGLTAVVLTLIFAPAPPVNPSALTVDHGISIDDSTLGSNDYFVISGIQAYSMDEIKSWMKISPAVRFSVLKPTASSNDAKVFLKNITKPEYTVVFSPPDIATPVEQVVSVGALTARLENKTITVGERVEIIFSRPVEEQAVRDHLKITPRVSFSVHCTAKVAYITLNNTQNMPADYEISFGEDMRSREGVWIEDGIVLPFSVKTLPEFKVGLVNRDATIAAADRPVLLEFDTQDRSLKSFSLEAPAVIKMYRFASIEKYEEQYPNMRKYGIEPSDMLEMVYSDIHVLSHGTSVHEIPNPGVGAYYITVAYENPLTGEHESFTKPLVVTELDVYMQSAQKQTLLWANSKTLGRISGYDVDFLSLDYTKTYASFKTDQDGLGIVEQREIPDAGEMASGMAVRIRNPKGAVVYLDRTDVVTNYSDDQTGGRYYSYFYLDRSIYKPTDEISFWGLVKPHASNDAPAPTEVRIVFDPYGLEQAVTVAVEPSGVFHGTLSLEQIKSANYSIHAMLKLDKPEKHPYRDEMVDEVQLDSEYIEIKQYEKPMFKIDSSTDQTLYNVDETVTLRIEPTFYDGTPMPNYGLELTVFDAAYGEEALYMDVTTDSTGIATATFPAYQLRNDAHTWIAVKNRYRVKIADDGENITHEGFYTVIPSDTMFTGDITAKDNGDLVLRAALNGIDYTKITTDAQRAEIVAGASYSPYYGWSSYPEIYDTLRGEPRSGAVTGELKYSYSLINGKRMNTRIPLEGTATNGIFELPIDIPEDADMTRTLSVTAEIYTRDTGGRALTHNAYYTTYTYTSYNESEGEDDGIEGYSFAVTGADGESVLVEKPTYRNYNIAHIKDGDTFTLSLLQDGAAIANGGRLLYTVIQGGIIDRGFMAGNALRFTQSTDWANNVDIVAAYFDGEHVYPLYDTTIFFEKESARLTVEVASDKERYRPGEVVNIQVRTTDQNGQGVAGSACVSVVDEAVFALREQYVNALSTLYGGLHFYNYTNKYTTLTSRGVPEVEGRGDIGKAGAENLEFYDIYRKNFKDTANFSSVRTNSQGYAQVSFTLPDNTTAWRITTVAIGDNMYAGEARANFTSGLPFFIAPVVSPKYIEGDDIALLVQGHGIVLNGDSNINYSVTIKGDGVNETEQLSNTAYKSNLVNFGKLSCGEYTIVAKASYSGYSDTVEIPVAVISSNLELVVSADIDLSKPVDIKAMRFPVTMSFYDNEHRAYFSNLRMLLRHYCMMANQRMSRYVAKQALMAYMEPESIPQHIRAGNDSVSDMQNYDGGIGWNEDQPSNPLLTVRILLVAKDQFNLNSMARYFDGILNNSNEKITYTKEEIAATYLGLAALGSPVKEEVTALLEFEDTRLLEKAYLVAALAYSGETTDALRWYDEIFAPLVTVSGDTKFVNVSKNERENAKITKTVLLTLSKLGHSDADSVAMYFADNSWRIDSLFESMVYVTNYNKEIQPRAFNYTVGGETLSCDLGLSGQRTLVFNKSDFESFKLLEIPEGVSATAFYIGEPSEANFTRSDRIEITKEIVPISDSRYRADITLQLAPDAPEGYYDISDWIPTNMRFYGIDKTHFYWDNTSDWWYYYKMEGQKMYFYVRKTRRTEEPIVISYYMQKTHDAQAMMDSTYVIHGDSGETNFTPRYIWNE